MSEKNIFYGKTESQMVAGVAILLMIWHHLFSYPNWLIDTVNVNSALGKYVNYLVWLSARIGNICIYIFAFQSGYSMYQRPELYSTLRKRIHRISSFLLSYWIVCAFFWMIGWIFNETLPTPMNALLNLAGLEVGFYTDWINVTFAWYVFYYILLVLSFPLLNACFRTDNYVAITLAVIGFIFGLLLLSYSGVQGFWKPFPASIMGMLSSKYRLFEYISDKVNQYLPKNRIWFVCLCGVVLFRIIVLYILSHNCGPTFEVFSLVLEGAIAFAFIFVLISLIHNIWLSRILCFLGSISMFLWFFHSILFTGSRHLQKFVYFSSEPIVIFIVTLLIFIPISYAFSMLCQVIRKLL